MAVMTSPTGPAPTIWTRLSDCGASIVLGPGIGDITPRCVEIVEGRGSRTRVRCASWRALPRREAVLCIVRHAAEHLAQGLGSPAARETDETAKHVGREVLPGALYQPFGELLGYLHNRFPRRAAKGLEQAHQVHPGKENQSLARGPRIAGLPHALHGIFPGDVPIAAIVEKQQSMGPVVVRRMRKVCRVHPAGLGIWRCR